MKQRQQVAVGGAIFNKHQEILLVRRVADDEFMPGVWEIPGGGTEYGEKPEEGLKREIMEECGLEITVGKRVEITFLCDLLSNSEDIVLSDEHDSFVWKSFDNLRDLEMTEYMAEIIRAVKEVV